MLLASAMKAPGDPAQAAKAVWEAYYANHQKKGALTRKIHEAVWGAQTAGAWRVGGGTIAFDPCRRW